VIGHRPHHRRPADPQVTSDRRDRVGVLADPPAGLRPGPLGQHRPRPDLDRLLGPGPDRTRWLHHRLHARRTVRVRDLPIGARVPQAAQPTVVAVVWTPSRHSSSMTAAAVTSNPSRPRRTDPDALPC
jgi:hypothetical protein